MKTRIIIILLVCLLVNMCKVNQTCENAMLETTFEFKKAYYNNNYYGVIKSINVEKAIEIYNKKNIFYIENSLNKKTFKKILKYWIENNFHIYQKNIVEVKYIIKINKIQSDEYNINIVNENTFTYEYFKLVLQNKKWAIVECTYLNLIFLGDK